MNVTSYNPSAQLNVHGLTDTWLLKFLLVSVCLVIGPKITIRITIVLIKQLDF